VLWDSSGIAGFGPAEQGRQRRPCSAHNVANTTSYQSSFNVIPGLSNRLDS